MSGAVFVFVQSLPSLDTNIRYVIIFFLLEKTRFLVNPDGRQNSGFIMSATPENADTGLGKMILTVYFSDIYETSTQQVSIYRCIISFGATVNHATYLIGRLQTREELYSQVTVRTG